MHLLLFFRVWLKCEIVLMIKAGQMKYLQRVSNYKLLLKFVQHLQHTLDRDYTIFMGRQKRMLLAIIRCLTIQQTGRNSHRLAPQFLTPNCTF